MLVSSMREAKARNVTPSEFITYVREHPRAEEEVKQRARAANVQSDGKEGKMAISGISS